MPAAAWVCCCQVGRASRVPERLAWISTRSICVDYHSDHHLRLVLLSRVDFVRSEAFCMLPVAVMRGLTMERQQEGEDPVHVPLTADKDTLARNLESLAHDRQAVRHVSWQVGAKQGGGQAGWGHASPEQRRILFCCFSGLTEACL